jgi:hypothetical protein
MSRMQEMRDRALALVRENHSLEKIMLVMRMEGYSLEELGTIERWVNELWVKQREQREPPN